MIKPKIFSSQPLKFATSIKDDGHTSFGHIEQTQTENNINRFIDKLNWNIKSRAFMRITYGKTRTYDVITELKSANNSDQVKFDEALITDALFTDVNGVALMLPTADCYAVTIFDPVKRVLALAHLGWHSTDARLLEKIIRQLAKSFDSNPKDILVHFGPGIPKQYYVYKEPIQLGFPSWKPYLIKVADGYQIDLIGYNLEKLKLAGINDHNIEIDPRNVVEDANLESHYMHNKNNQPTAKRFLTAVMIETN